MQIQPEPGFLDYLGWIAQSPWSWIAWGPGILAAVMVFWRKHAVMALWLLLAAWYATLAIAVVGCGFR